MLLLIIDLTAVITPNNLEMKDEERLKRIDTLYTDMQEAYTFSQSFRADVKLLALQWMKEEADVRTSGVLNNIQNK